MSADPVGALADVIKRLGAVHNNPEPVLGTWNSAKQSVVLDTGQTIFRPLILLETPANGQRVFAIYYQRGHAVAIIPIAGGPVA